MIKNLVQVDKKRWYICILSLIIIILDQYTKYIVTIHIPQQTILYDFLNGFLQIVHIRNKGMAFGLGASWIPWIRFIIFIVMPMFFLLFFMGFALVSDNLWSVHRWLIAGICGGGWGNAIDRMFRPEGVVDFIRVKVYGLFGLEYWPVFNVADASVVVCGVTLMVLFIVHDIHAYKVNHKQKEG